MRRPRWLPWVAAILVAILFFGLGYWQLQRAAEKRAWLASLKNGTVLRRVPDNEAALRRAAYRRIRVTGRFRPKHQILLDNRIVDGHIGFDVLTPFVLADGRTILVDRGWIPATAQREPLRPVDFKGPRRATVTGRLWLPESGIEIGPVLAQGTGWPRLATRIDFAAFSEALGMDLVPAVIRATGEAPWMYRPRELKPGFGPRRHYGYAFQWFALAVTVLAIACILEWRRQRTGGQ